MKTFAIFLLSKETLTIRTCSILESFFRKLLSQVTFERKLSSVSLVLRTNAWQNCLDSQSRGLLNLCHRMSTNLLTYTMKMSSVWNCNLTCTLVIQLTRRNCWSRCLALFRSPRFLGGRQQDSHEALRHLLDGVKEEHQELKRQQVRVLTIQRVLEKTAPLSIMA